MDLQQISADTVEWPKSSFEQDHTLSRHCPANCANGRSGSTKGKNVLFTEFNTALGINIVISTLDCCGGGTSSWGMM